MLLATLPAKVMASDGEWNTGTSVAIDLKAYPAPSGLQLFSDGVKITAAAAICHPFDQGRSNWLGTIYEWKAGKWVKLPTTMAWIPSTEGRYTACAQAKEAGTFALFGFYNVPKMVIPVPVINLSGHWNTGTAVAIDMKKYPAPNGWQFFSTGAQAANKTKICHPFSFGTYGWDGQIWVLKDGEWVKLASTSAWVPNKEGTYTTCATTTEAGTYVLFGFLKSTLVVIPPPTPDLSGRWNTGTAFTLDLKKNPAPGWLQLLSTGVNVTAKTQICHPFPFGINGWIGEIWQLKAGQWSKLPTTAAWVPNKEGTYTACATAPEAGSYALFGYVP